MVTVPSGPILKRLPPCKVSFTTCCFSSFCISSCARALSFSIHTSAHLLHSDAHGSLLEICTTANHTALQTLQFNPYCNAIRTGLYCILQFIEQCA
eukprot:jgi/Botrbrau1/17631/Bobra.0166s0062.1